ncbi:MAG: hypothetical protein AVDCRST_MAG39-1307 [uncultured Sphingomonadaceae bacterium]|uniref:Uncharacterized protein n=1 Tax=uncultured Sphingomonadaceae bacterium TaxID=169976 RepID=A0A6J4SIQ6_9SPHN|nr:MAG: hypothetical protein AVDCRST_MAG39-1307 [uncultured Sphingomonadaceae bacterium]
MPVQALLWWTAGAAALLTALASLAERRRAARADLDRVGWVPWRGLSFLGFAVAVLALAFAVRG